MSPSGTAADGYRAEFNPEFSRGRVSCRYTRKGLEDGDLSSPGRSLLRKDQGSDVLSYPAGRGSRGIPCPQTLEEEYYGQTTH
jgi:hypothetical protein